MRLTAEREGREAAHGALRPSLVGTAEGLAEKTRLGVASDALSARTVRRIALLWTSERMFIATSCRVLRNFRFGQYISNVINAAMKTRWLSFFATSEIEPLFRRFVRNISNVGEDVLVRAPRKISFELIQASLVLCDSFFWVQPNPSQAEFFYCGDFDPSPRNDALLQNSIPNNAGLCWKHEQ